MTEEEAYEVFGKRIQGCNGVVEIGLSTLAMGDKLACEFSQCAHVGLLLQHHVCRAEELLCLRNAIPRGLLQVGIIIDDLVILEKTLLSTFLDTKTDPAAYESSLRAKAAREAYRQVGLRNNPKKGFEAATKAKFWGIEIDGEKGFVRCSSSRMWPTIAISMRVASLGLCTISLLESLAGSWVSLLAVRRRMYSILDLIFGPLGAGLEHDDVVRLSDEMRSELIAICTLAPLAVVNLRAGFCDFVAATDASTDAMAGVHADIPVKVVAEVSRHSLRKGVWSRLLPVEKAWLKEHDLLLADDELPAEGFRAHPFWDVLARCPRYYEKWRRKVVKRYHINVLELKAHLYEEQRLCNSMQRCRVPFALD